MGDETDALDLPLHQVSGNLDRGHISEINRQELSEQAQAINTALNRFYSCDSNFNNDIRGIQIENRYNLIYRLLIIVLFKYD